MNNNQIDFVTVSEAAVLEELTERKVTGRCSKRSHKQHYHGAEQVDINGVETWRIPVNSLSSKGCATYRINQREARQGRAIEGENDMETLDLTEKRSSVKNEKVECALDHSQSPVNIERMKNIETIDARPISEQRSSVLNELLTIKQAADLLGVHEATIRSGCRKGKYSGTQKQLGNGGEGWLIPITNLLTPAQHVKYIRNQQKALKAETSAILAKSGVKEFLPVVQIDHHAEHQQMLDAYDRKPANFKRPAEQRLLELRVYKQYLAEGMNIGQAEAALKVSHGVSKTTIWRYLGITKNYPEYCWVALLCPKHHGGRARAEFTEAAFAHILNERIQAPQAKLIVIYRDAKKIGAGLGWVIPDIDTVANRLKEMPAHLFLTDRELERSFPVIVREYSMLVNVMWETDGRKLDMWCVWPDGTVARPFVIIYRDLRSRYVLSVRICHAPDIEAAAGAFGTALKTAQAVPQYMKVDNGREYDNKTLTAGQENRYRKNFMADTSDGLWTEMGIVARFSKPANGRDKAIESFWNVIKMNVDQSSMFTEAYCGHNVLAIPDAFDKKNAAPVGLLAVKIIEAIYADTKDYKGYHHSPHGGKGMNGRSPHEVFHDTALRAPQRKPLESEMRKCRMGKQQLKLDSKEASFMFKLKGCDWKTKYVAPELLNIPTSQRSTKFDVYYDYGEPTSPISVWQNGGYICDAYPKETIDFIALDKTEMVAHMEAKNKYIASVKRYKKVIEKAGEQATTHFNAYFATNQIGELNGSLVIAPSAKLPVAAAPVSPIQAVPGKPGEYINIDTNEIYKGDEALEEERLAQLKAETAVQDTAKYLEELQKKREEELRSSAYE